MLCPVCALRACEVGVLCEECRDELSSPIKITPEQIQLHGSVQTLGVLVDPWGRPFRLDASTIVGRHLDASGLSILEASVSRHHASLELNGTEWTVRDLGSANGTWYAEAQPPDMPIGDVAKDPDDHKDKLISTPVVLHDKDRVRFGHIGFYFFRDASKLPAPRLGRTMTATIKPLDRKLMATSPEPDSDFKDKDEDEITHVGLPTLSFKLHEPTGGGGGLIEVNNKRVQLTTTQFELMALMIRRMAGESHQPEIVRGFVRSSELIADLSWDTREPSENHVKQLVRRVRRALIKSEIGDLIESRHRFGYRLRAIPRTE